MIARLWTWLRDAAAFVLALVLLALGARWLWGRRSSPPTEELPPGAAAEVERRQQEQRDAADAEQRELDARRAARDEAIREAAGEEQREDLLGFLDRHGKGPLVLALLLAAGPAAAEDLRPELAACVDLAERQAKLLEPKPLPDPKRGCEFQEGEARISCPTPTMENLRRHLVACSQDRALALAHLADAGEDTARAVELERELAATRERGLEAEVAYWRERGAPPSWVPWALGAGGTAVAAAGVACLVADGCPGGAGWGAVAGGGAAVAVGFGLSW